MGGDRGYELDFKRDIEPVYEAIKAAADAEGWNGPSFCMLVMELKKLDKPVGDLTLKEFAEVADRVGKEYNRLFSRAAAVREMGKTA